MNHNEISRAINIPTNGARIIKEAVFSTTAEFTAENPPAWAIAAPANPPINVCDEEEGMPDHQVSRFHTIAAISPENITSSVIHSCFTVLAIVLATP